MAAIKRLMEMTVNAEAPVEEIKEVIIAISICHGPNQLAILKEIELWLGKTIEDAKAKLKQQEKPEVKDDDPGGNA